MPNSLVQHAFSGGEIAATSRSDIETYQRSLSKSRNYLPMPDGSLRKRDGTRHVSDLYDNPNSSETRRSRFFTFPGVGDDAYVIEISAQGNFEVIKNGEKIYFDMTADLTITGGVADLQDDFKPAALTGKMEDGMRVQLLGAADGVESPLGNAGQWLILAEDRLGISGVREVRPRTATMEVGTGGDADKIKHTLLNGGDLATMQGSYVRFFTGGDTPPDPPDVRGLLNDATRFQPGPFGLQKFWIAKYTNPDLFWFYQNPDAVPSTATERLHGVTEADMNILFQGVDSWLGEGGIVVRSDIYDIVDDVSAMTDGSYTNQAIRVLVGGYHPYVGAEIDTLTYASSANVLTLFHPDYPPVDLIRYDDFNWGLRIHTATVGGVSEPLALTSGVGGGAVGAGDTRDYVVTAVDSQNGAESRASAITTTFEWGRKLSWSAPAFGVAARYNVYAGDTEAFGFIGSSPSESFELGVQPGITPDTTIGKDVDPFLASASNFGCGTYWQQRLVMAGPSGLRVGDGEATGQIDIATWTEAAESLRGPTRVAMSGSDNYYYFGTGFPAIDSDGLLYAISSRSPDIFHHAIGARDLFLFSSDEVWVARAENGAVGVGNPPAFELVDADGASAARPVVVGGSILYVTASDDRLIELGFRFESDKFDPEDLTILHPEALKSGVRDLAQTSDKAPIVWALRNDGVLMSCTRVPSQGIFALAFHDTPGGMIESIAAAKENGRDVLYMAVDRGDIGAFVERMFYDEGYEDAVDAVFVDSARVLTPEPIAGEASQTTPAAMTAFNPVAQMEISYPAITGLLAGQKVFCRHFLEPDDPRERSLSSIHNRRVVVEAFGPNILQYESDLSDVDGTVHAADTHLEDFRDGRPASLVYPTFRQFTDAHINYFDTGVVYVCDGEVIQDSGPGDPVNGSVILLSTAGTTKQERTGVVLDALAEGKRYGVCMIGIPYTAEMQLLPIAPQFQSGSVQGRVSVAGKVKVGLRRSQGGLIGQTNSDLNPLLYPTRVLPAVGPKPLFTGYVEATVTGQWSDTDALVIRSSDQHPHWITSIAYEVEFGGGL